MLSLGSVQKPFGRSPLSGSSVGEPPAFSIDCCSRADGAVFLDCFGDMCTRRSPVSANGPGEQRQEGQAQRARHAPPDTAQRGLAARPSGATLGVTTDSRTNKRPTVLPPHAARSAARRPQRHTHAQLAGRGQLGRGARRVARTSGWCAKPPRGAALRRARQPPQPTNAQRAAQTRRAQRHVAQAALGRARGRRAAGQARRAQRVRAQSILQIQGPPCICRT